jgi:hypothetical protein
MALIPGRHRAGVTIVLVLLLAVSLLVGLFIVLPSLVGRGPTP